MYIEPVKLFRATLYSSLILAAMFFGLFILSAFYQIPGECNSNNLHIVGHGDVYIRHDMPDVADYASGEDVDAEYRSKILWGISDWGVKREDSISSEYHVKATYEDWKNKFRIEGSGAGNKISYTATHLNGTGDFASEIHVKETAAGDDSLVSTIMFDTRDGSAQITGRIINSTDNGRPATFEEVDLVGKFLIESQLNISKPAITPENWLGSCAELNHDMILDEDVPDGIYILPEGYELNKNLQLVPIKPK